MDKRIYAIALILFMSLILIFFFLINNRDNRVRTNTEITVNEGDNTLYVNIERPVSADEKKDLEDKAKDGSGGKKVDVQVAAPYDDSDENLDFIEQKANNPEDQATRDRIEENFGSD